MYIYIHIYIHCAPYGPHTLPDQPCSQHQGALAAAMPPPLARLASPLHHAAAGGRTVQDNGRLQQNTQAGRHAAHGRYFCI